MMYFTSNEIRNFYKGSQLNDNILKTYENINEELTKL